MSDHNVRSGTSGLVLSAKALRPGVDSYRSVTANQFSGDSPLKDLLPTLDLACISLS